MSSEERMAILQMLAESKISVEEAEKLLKAVREEPASETPREQREPPRGRELSNLLEEIGAEVRKAVKSVQASEVGRTVSQEVNNAIDSLQRANVGQLVGEIVTQVRTAVAEAVEGAGGRSVVENLEWTLDGAGLARLQAETTSGQVQLRGTTGDRVAVTAIKKVRAHTEEEAQAFAREVEVHAVREGETVRVYKEHPKLPRGIHVEVSYQIECPRCMEVDLRTVNGNVRCRAIEGQVQAHSSNGNVRVEECTGRIEARTRNGNAQAVLDELLEEGLFTTVNGNVAVQLRAGQAPLTATTTNGNVEVAVPDGFAGRLDARTTNGSVCCDLELTYVEQQKRTLLVGQLGVGGHAEIRLHTLNGNVRLKPLQQENIPAQSLT